MTDVSKPATATEVTTRIEDDATLGRRAVLGGLGAAAVATTLLRSTAAHADPAPAKSMAASPPDGFTPLTVPGKVIKVTKADCLQENKLYPKQADATLMLMRAMTELTGKSDLIEAIKLFIHPNDVVCVKLNGIAESKMGTNKELVLPLLEAMIAAGVPAEKITVLEQYGSFLAGTRINAGNVPKGVKVEVHTNSKATMAERQIAKTGVKTKFVSALTDATAVINVSLIKDHSIHGYTGLLKNMTHGCQIYPHYFHARSPSAQIAHLYNDEIISSRVRLHVTDGYKIMAQGGPLYKSPRHVIPHESVYVTTDPVAMDTIGWGLVEKARADFNLKSLKDDGREPLYIAVAGTLGLGVSDLAQIQLQEFTI
jgi:uncharacterized protein (DUF362 family)